MDQLGDRRGIKAEARGCDVGQEAGAGGVIGVEELVRAADGIFLAIEKVLLVPRGEECREMMVEPPGNARRGRVFEVDDGVLVAGKLTLVKERAGAVHQPVKLVLRVRLDALAVEAREQRG